MFLLIIAVKKILKILTIKKQQKMRKVYSLLF